MDRNINKKWAAATAVSMALGAASAYAEPSATSDDSLGELVVTAQRRSESAMKVPLAVTAVTQSDLTSRAIVNSSELAGLVPTLQVNSAFGDVQPNFTLRGIGVSNEHNPNQASPIGVYIDDAYISARVSQGLQLFDLDRIEILRGPQGTLYGRNTTGGAINFISHQPGLDGSSGNYEVGYGDFNTFTAAGAYEATLAPGVSGLRVAFNYAHGDGFNRNVFPSQPAANSTDSAAFRAIYRLKPTDALDMTFKLTFGNSNPTQAGVYNLGLGANGANTALQTSRAAQGLGFWEIDSNRLGSNSVKDFGAEFTLKYNINDAVSLYSLTSFNHANAVFTQEGTGVNSPVFVQPLDTLYGNRFGMVNQELRVSYDSVATKAQAGVYFGYDKDDSDSYYWLLDGAADVHQKYTQLRKSYAAFAQMDQALTQKLTLTLGVRVTKDKNSYQDYSSYLEPGANSYTAQRDTSAQYWNPATGVFFLGSYDPALGRVVSGPTIELDSARPTYRAALNYTFDSGQILYASFNTGYRGAAFCGQCFLQSTIDQTKPETDTAYEIGTKGLFFDRKLSLTADAFWIDYRNQQTNEQIGLQTILNNVPKSRMRGAELEATARPVRDLRFGLSLGYLDASFQQLTLAYGVLNGVQEPYAPKWTATARMDWQLANVAAGTVTLTPTLVYTSNVFFSPYNAAAGNGPLSQPANTKVNGTLAWDNSHYNVRAWVKNLTNKETFGDGLDLRASFGYYYLVPLAPRTFGISAGYKF